MPHDISSECGYCGYWLENIPRTAWSYTKKYKYAIITMTSPSAEKKCASIYWLLGCREGRIVTHRLDCTTKLAHPAALGGDTSVSFFNIFLQLINKQTRRRHGIWYCDGNIASGDLQYWNVKQTRNSYHVNAKIPRTTTSNIDWKTTPQLLGTVLLFTIRLTTVEWIFHNVCAAQLSWFADSRRACVAKFDIPISCCRLGFLSQENNNRW